MAIIKGKKDKIVVRPTEEKTAEITPLRPYSLWTDMDQLFNQFRSNFDDLFFGPRGSAFSGLQELRAPTMDVCDLGDKYEMSVEMPGIPKEKINIELTPNSIEISANHDTTDEEKTKNWLRRERSSTSFYRRVELPEEVKTDNSEAELKDGILTLQLQKMQPKPEYKTTKVKIK